MGQFMYREKENQIQTDEPHKHIHGNCILPTDDIKEYCCQMIGCEFFGQTNLSSAEGNDESNTSDILHLGLYIKLLDAVLREYEPSEFPEEEEQFNLLLNLIACKRHHDAESTDICHQRLLADAKRFIKIYRTRNKKSEVLEHKQFWGTRQQLLSGKVIADYVDRENGPLDPIFGVLLNPTAGRVGPGDSGWIHNLLYDDTGFMAYHSAVHDGFGYLKRLHDIGPGYDYLDVSFLDDSNPLAGQQSGIFFWRSALDDVQQKIRVINALKL